MAEQQVKIRSSNTMDIHLIDITVRVKCSLCIDSRFDFDVEKGLLHHIRVKHHLKELTEEFKAECITMHQSNSNSEC